MPARTHIQMSRTPQKLQELRGYLSISLVPSGVQREKQHMDIKLVKSSKSSKLYVGYAHAKIYAFH